jgi:hypothetical protein
MKTYNTDAFIDGLILHVLYDLGRVYWNINQKSFDEYTPVDWKWLVYRPYYWGDDEKIMDLPNLEVGGAKIFWYKHPGRGMYTDVDWNSDEWRRWINTVMNDLSEYEKRVCEMRLEAVRMENGGIP